jgi:hypothetical protein
MNNKYELSRADPLVIVATGYMFADVKNPPKQKEEAFYQMLNAAHQAGISEGIGSITKIALCDYGGANSWRVLQDYKKTRLLELTGD